MLVTEELEVGLAACRLAAADLQRDEDGLLNEYRAYESLLYLLITKGCSEPN